MARAYVVTGCANGIGAETARILKADGGRVIGLDLAEPDVNVDQFIPFDLADARSIDMAVAQVPGDLAGVANIAGLPPRPGQEALVLNVNYVGQRRFMRGMLDRLRTGASVVNLASRAGRDWPDNIDQVKRLTEAEDLEAFVTREGIDATRAYRLSKEAMILWTYAESEALTKRGYRINCVSPSAVDTAILGDFLAAFGPAVNANVERTGRPASASEIAEIVVFLLSERSRWIRGTDIWTDGGMSAFAASDRFELSGLKCL